MRLPVREVVVQEREAVVRDRVLAKPWKGCENEPGRETENGCCFGLAAVAEARARARAGVVSLVPVALVHGPVRGLVLEGAR